MDSLLEKVIEVVQSNYEKQEEEIMREFDAGPPMFPGPSYKIIKQEYKDGVLTINDAELLMTKSMILWLEKVCVNARIDDYRRKGDVRQAINDKVVRAWIRTAAVKDLLDLL